MIASLQLSNFQQFSILAILMLGNFQFWQFSILVTFNFITANYNWEYKQKNRDIFCLLPFSTEVTSKGTLSPQSPKWNMGPLTFRMADPKLSNMWKTG